MRNILVPTLALLAFCALAACSTGADTAADTLTGALTAACRPWMEGATRAELSAALKSVGWRTTDDAIFVKSGEWGRVQAALQQPEGETKPSGNDAKPKRACRIDFNTDQNPWSTDAATTAIATWIETTYPAAVKTSTGPIIIEARTLDATAWVNDDLKFTQAVQKSKQTQPTFDLLFLVRRD